MKALTDSEVQAVLQSHPGWRLAEGKLVRDFHFSTFVEALAFVNRVGTLAEAQQHHPDIDIRYNQVTLGLISHDAKGLTERDARFAAFFDAEFLR